MSEDEAAVLSEPKIQRAIGVPDFFTIRQRVELPISTTRTVGVFLHYLSPPPDDSNKMDAVASPPAR